MIDFCMSTLYLCPLTEFHSILDSSEMPFDKAGLSCDNNDTVKSFSFHAFIHWIHFSWVFCSRGSTHGIHWTVVLDRKKWGNILVFWVDGCAFYNKDKQEKEEQWSSRFPGKLAVEKVWKNKLKMWIFLEYHIWFLLNTFGIVQHFAASSVNLAEFHFYLFCAGFQFHFLFFIYFNVSVCFLHNDVMVPGIDAAAIKPTLIYFFSFCKCFGMISLQKTTNPT